MLKKVHGTRVLKKNIILLGPPGSRKGTQAAIFNKEGYKIISTGDLLRNQVRSKTELGLIINKLMAKGKLVSDNIIIKLIKDDLLKSKNIKGIIFDGFPRNINQAKELKKIFQIDFVIDIDTPNDLIMKRLVDRYICSKCGKSYNKNFNNPKVKGVCDVCKSKKFEKRVDDNHQTIKKRIKQHYKNSSEIIKFYKKERIYFKVDGSKNSDITNLNINSIIKKIE